MTQASLEEVRADTDAAMQRVVDHVGGGILEDLSGDEPYAQCSDTGYNYTARWSVRLEPGFDGDRLVAELPDRLGDDFTLLTDLVEVSYPAVGFQHKDGAVIDVSVVPDNGTDYVDIYGISPCGEGTPPRG